MENDYKQGKKPEMVKIAFDDYIQPLKNLISNELYGRLEDELDTHLPNMLKDEKKHVKYDATNGWQHAHIMQPKHPITITYVREETF